MSFIRVTLCLALAALSFQPLFAQETTPAKPKNWEPNIAAFEKTDKETPPPNGAILFVGSSSIVKWKTLEQDMAGATVLNRGFGGSQISDVNKYISRIVLPYEPKTIVLYAGDNDLGAKKTPEVVAADFKKFVELVRAKLPAVAIHFIAIKPSVKRAAIKEQQKQANALIKTYIESGENMSYIDVVPAMLDTTGNPRADIFLEDNLHMNPAGYVIWTKIVRERLGLK